MAEVRKAEDAARAQGFAAAKIEALADIGRAREEALVAGIADCEALVSAGLLALAEKEDEQEDAALAQLRKVEQMQGGEMIEHVQRLENAKTVVHLHKHRAACLREMSLAVSLGQFRTAECSERAIVAAHREAAGFNSSKAGGEARSRALSPAKRKKIATKAARARWAAKKGEP